MKVQWKAKAAGHFLSLREKRKALAICSESGIFVKCSQGIWPPYHYTQYESGQTRVMTPKSQGFIRKEV